MENANKTYIEMTPSGTPRVFAIQARVVKYNGRQSSPLDNLVSLVFAARTTECSRRPDHAVLQHAPFHQLEEIKTILQVKGEI